jgi:diguanylate cyclase (GGDEF)-like protein
MATPTGPEAPDPDAFPPEPDAGIPPSFDGAPGAPTPPTASHPADAQPAVADEWTSEINALLRELDGVAAGQASLPPIAVGETGDELVRVRLGTAAGLFAALQCKHPASAGHSLRVALTCSAWSMALELDGAERDAIEVSALLHDIGMIGAPDNILLKPGTLDRDEAAVVTRARQASLQILRRSCSSTQILEIVECVGAWYDGSRDGFPNSGKDIPLGARMIAVAEAYDAMTNDHVYRAAMSQERAVKELFDCAGTQFDRDLVKRFVEFLGYDQRQLREAVAGRWLRSLDPELVNSYWQVRCYPSLASKPETDALFQGKLLDNMYDAVMFIDGDGLVVLWNRGAERLTGIAGSTVFQRRWEPELLNIADEKGNPVHESDCPVTCAIRSGVQSLRRLTIWGRAGRPIAVDTHAIPVISDEGKRLGAILLFHDASSETSLEQRCQSLHEKATRDPLTQVANRAEFDRVHEMFVDTHRQQHVPCSLIIGDLDHFKRVNDTYGHQVGDEVIKSLATLLKNSCRPGDLVARYGGEEFVILCTDCDITAATRRAEQIRGVFGRMPQEDMGGRCATVSFGVTQIQPGDTPETMLRRADRGLLMAKSQGRNQVVQLGTGSADELDQPKTAVSDKTPGRQFLIQRTLVTPVPVKMTIEKLRGFVADHQAKIIATDENQVRLEISEQRPSRLRRFTDRPVTFCMALEFEEERFRKDDQDESFSGPSRTRIRLSIHPKRNRDRRRNGVGDRAQEVLVSIRSYLMASEEGDDTAGKGVVQRAKQIITPWLNPS